MVQTHLRDLRLLLVLVRVVYIINRALHGCSMIWVLCSREQYLTCSLSSLVRYCTNRHSNIKPISSRHRII